MKGSSESLTMTTPFDQIISSPVTTLQRVFLKLHLTDSQFSKETREDLLSSLSIETCRYLQDLPEKAWPLKPNSVPQDMAERTQLKKYLGFALENNEFQKAVAVVLCLEGCPTDPLDASLFDDVMQYIEEKGPTWIIPPQLLICWARHLQIKGDLHGAIRRLNTAKALLQENKLWFPCQCEAERIRGDCLQLAGLTLNKMCCWKSAVQPLMESVDIFQGCAANEQSAAAAMVSVEMAAKCLCSITHGDFLELKEQLAFQHNDRFFQAYSMCRDSSSVAPMSSLLLYTKTQNRAAESILKYSAQQDDDSTRYRYLQQVITEAQKGLQALNSLSDLTHREQFFEFIHSIFLMYMALSFSDMPPDRTFADRLDKHARLLYSEYCKQLSENEFELERIDLKRCPDVENIIDGLSETFNLKLGRNYPGHTVCGKDPQKGEREQNRSNGDHQHGNTVGEITLGTLNTHPGPEAGIITAEKRSGDEGLKMSSSRLQEVGLPVNPEDYAIPVYDVPLTIFQDLCGCKFTETQTGEEKSQQSNGESVFGEDGPENQQRIADMVNPVDGIAALELTEDSGYGSSVALVETCLTTKLPHSEVSSSQYMDSGVDSSFSCTDSNVPRSAGNTCNISSQPTVLTDSVKKARLLKFNPVTGLWSSQTSMVYVGQPLKLEDRLKGNCRDALHVQFLHQDEVLGRYVGKRYRRQKPPSQYLQDVTCQKTARFLVTLFNYALKDLRYDIQVVYVPVAHVQLLSHDGKEIEDWLNVEPYLEGDFTKLTNNLKFCNSQGRTLATALTHFTYSVSEGKLMLVDLQGWLPREGRGVVYLTDPQFHTNTPTSLSSCDMGPRGMQAFWESVHPECNAICRALGLKRPQSVDP